MSAKVIMVQGCTSDAGKTVVVAGLCRLLAKRQYRVAPFKPQNMALNSAVTDDGGEIGRAQALQAVACGIKAHSDMNPILLKPSSDTKAQVIVQGRALSDMEAQGFHDYKKVAMQAVLQSFGRLRESYDYVVVEGAGSPAEINLREGDIANMGFAEAVDCPVILVADIDKGGVFAHLVGTLALLSESEQNRVIGFVINKFRGERALLEGGLEWLEKKTGKPVLGVLPYLKNFYLDAEDAVATEQNLDVKQHLRVVVPVYPRISNHTDFDALRLHANIDLQFVAPGEPLPACDLIILAGSKNVRADLLFFRESGWHDALARHLRYGGKVLGICGGYQMLGLSIDDPSGVEQEAGRSDGLGYIPMHTQLTAQKTLMNKQGYLCFNDRRVAVSGYEIHVGKSYYTQSQKALLEYASAEPNEQYEGYVSDDGLVAGTYLHGLFDSEQGCEALLHWCEFHGSIRQQPSLHDLRESELERLSVMLEQELNWPALDAML